jgi:hypothetical protein
MPRERAKRTIVRKCAGRIALSQSDQFPMQSGTMEIALSF